MANRSRARRKRRPTPAEASAPSPAQRAGQPRAERARAPRAPVPPTPTFGSRPEAPWHPLPLSEILILAGAIGTVIALGRNSHGGLLLIASLAAVGLGTVEVAVREHWSGYRSHAILLALAVTLAFHSLVVIGASAVANPRQLLNFVLLPIDFALFVVLFRALRARFLEARQRRAVTGG